MAQLNTLHGDYYVNGTFGCKTLNAPAGSIANLAVALNAAEPIDAGKLEHRHRHVYAQESATTVVDETRVAHVVGAAAAVVGSVLVRFEAGMIVAALGDAICEFDLLKNGVSVLTAPIELNSTHAARETVDATFSDDEATLDDVYEVSINGTIGTGTLGKGAFWVLEVEELPA